VRGRNSRGEATAKTGGDDSRERPFSPIYQGLAQAGAALTRRQGDFAEDPSEEGKESENVSGKLTGDGPFAGGHAERMGSAACD
jgi:hypothetical protein